MASQAVKQVYVLPLTDEGAPDVPGGYIYLPPPSNPPYSVRFQIEGTSSICRQGCLWVNVPEIGKQFERNSFREFKLNPDFNRNIEISIDIPCAGAFSFYTTYSPLPEFTTRQSIAPRPTRTATYYIDVCPKLSIRHELLPLDALSIFSVISKFMGKYPTDWEKHLQGISQRGYNMVHFTPLMERGLSNSPYSIFDQLRFDPVCFPNGEYNVSELVTRMEHEYGLLSLTDVVWNHTANNSKWLQEHPEAGYNISTAPWLQSALEIDDAIIKYSSELERLGLPTTLTSVDDLETVINGMQKHVIDAVRLWEFYVVDTKADTEAAIAAWLNNQVSFPESSAADFRTEGSLAIKSSSLEGRALFLKRHGLHGTDRLGERFRRRTDPKSAAGVLTAMFGKKDPSSRGSADEGAARNEMTKILDILNVNLYEEYDADSREIIEQTRNRVKYTRLDDHGPKLGSIDAQNPLVETYFTRLPENAATRKHGKKSLALINNGWIWNANALIDHAGPGSKAYTRREVIVWTDCVKLRYGESRSDSPFLWDFMEKYTRLMAKYFGGFRIDNCHSTPIYVAEYLLDQARQVRPDLYICAELFTGSEETDYVFVQRLGISSLIREAMQSSDVADLSRLVHRHGGRPIGSFEIEEITDSAQDPTRNREVRHRIKQTPVNALFMDCTHDNEVPAQKRDPRDTLPNAALVAMCACAVGSVMGYDEIYPKLVDLVNETRLYSSSYTGPIEEGDTAQVGIGGIKKLLNRIHTEMGKQGFDETFIHQEKEYITVHRMSSDSRKGYFLIAHNAFLGHSNSTPQLADVTLRGTKVKPLGAWNLQVDASQEARDSASSQKSLSGLPGKVVKISDIQVVDHDAWTGLRLPAEFPPGSIALLETWVPRVEPGLDRYFTSGVRDVFSMVDLIDLNSILYRCEPEERDTTNGKAGVYSVPGHGQLVYAGLQGWWSALKPIVRGNDLGHPLCEHLRTGRWALQYILDRSTNYAGQSKTDQLASLEKWVCDRLDLLEGLPNFLLPRYFALTVQALYNAAADRGLQLLGPNIRQSQTFVQQLALVSIQQTGIVGGASLYPRSQKPTLAAGLPHFSTSWARCWGRDIFISLRGLFLATGRFDQAKEHIIAFASVLKHGMIPNLLSDGAFPRYNSRDSIWFFLQAIQDYTKMAPDGIEILKEKVSRRFLPYDDAWLEHDDPRAYSTSSTLEDIIQEALQRHASGISFREARAGPGLDMQMKPEGFQIDIKVDWETGLIFGGNQFNCGTWQDKMGESERASSKGVPGTPRDGAAIEISGLLYSTLRWVSDLSARGRYGNSGVDVDGEKSGKISFKEWSKKIEQNFEKCYYVPLDPREDDQYIIDAGLVNRRGIYKDLFKAGKDYEDYQLRANFPIAMCVAPDLFDPQHALGALAIADKVLHGPMGMATLDPSDLNYRPYYNNSEDSFDFATSKGRNYHQGPEWLWPTGYFLRALLKFDLMRRKTKEEQVESFQQVTRRLQGCKKALEESPWAGLTELTNKNGEFCADSSPTQAWSAGCLIDLFYDASQLSFE